MPHRIAYMPLDTHPEVVSDQAVQAAVGMVAALNCQLQVTTFEVDIPPVASPLGGYLINIDGMARSVEERSRTECARLRALIEAAGEVGKNATVTTRKEYLGGVPGAAAAEARYFDLALVPWSGTGSTPRDMAQTLVFGAGVPVLLVPADTAAAPVSHAAIAWDESRAAARALSDALHLLPEGAKLSVLTVNGEKDLRGAGIPETLATALVRRGYAASAVNVSLDGRSIATALQEVAKAQGAQMLVMGGFGHSRLRDFILGGATKAILEDLRMPVLLSH